MIDLNKMTLLEFNELDTDTMAECLEYLKHVKPIDTKKKISELKFREVEYIKKHINDDDALPRIFKDVQGLDEKKLMKLNVVKFFGLFKSIQNQLVAILSKEDELLNPKHANFKWEAVEGSKRLSKLGTLPMIDTLAGGDVLKYDDIINLPYMTILSKLYLDTLKSDIQIDMDKIKTKHND